MFRTRFGTFLSLKHDLAQVGNRLQIGQKFLFDLHGVIYRKAPVARLRISFAVRCFGYIRSGQINLDFVIHIAPAERKVLQCYGVDW